MNCLISRLAVNSRARHEQGSVEACTTMSAKFCRFRVKVEQRIFSTVILVGVATNKVCRCVVITSRNLRLCCPVMLAADCISLESSFRHCHIVLLWQCNDHCATLQKLTLKMDAGKSPLCQEQHAKPMPNLF